MKEYQVLRNQIEEYYHLNDQEWEFVSQYFELKKVKKNTHLITDGQFVHDEYFIVSGVVRAYEIDEDGKEFIIQFGKETWWISDYNALVNKTLSKMNVECVIDCTLLCISRKDQEFLCLQMHQMANFFRKIVEKNYVFVQQRLLSQMRETAEERYNSLLQRSPDLVQRVPKKLLASYLGVSKETLSRF